MNKIRLTTIATLMGISSLAHAAPGGVNLTANEIPVDVAKNAAAAAKIPADYKFVTPGTLTVAIPGTGSEPPFAVLARDNKTIIGSETDIARLVADGLGLKIKFVPTSWEDWPLGVSSGRYDAALFNITVTKARKTKYDFATYRTNNPAFFVSTRSKITSITQPADIAGKRIIVGPGTTQETIILAWDKVNQAHGLKPAQLIYTTDEAAASLDLQSGRADATFAPYSTSIYKANLTGTTRLAGIVPSGWPKTTSGADIAITLKKGTGLVNAVQASLNAAIANGSYQKVLNRWGETKDEVKQSEINPPGLGD